MNHEQHPLAGKTVKIKDAGACNGEVAEGQEYRIEDWWDKATGGSWMYADGNPAALKYAIRAGTAKPGLPLDDEVVYGKIGSFGHLLHASEIGDVVR
jgi:hypothetical protein